MRLLVTGGAGFLGSRFTGLWLARHPADEIVALDLLTYAGSRARLAEAERTGRCRFVQGDVCHARTVRRALEGVQAAVHFAAETHVDRSITDAVPFLRTNIEGTHTLLREANAVGLGRIVHVSTDEVYGPILVGAADERAPLSPRSPYAASKAAGDCLAQAFCATYRLPVIIARPTNVFGPWQLPEKFIPLCITNALDRRPVPIYGDGMQRRSWLDVTDCCEALALLVERGRAGEIYNVAGMLEQANADTAKQILAALGQSLSLLQVVADRPGHDRRYALNDAKLRSLGWRPQVSFERGLKDTIAWYRDQADWWRPLAQHLRENPHHWLNRAPRAGAEQPAGTVG